MSFGSPGTTRSLRTLLILGRASNLPTVWSNCLAGWLLGGGGAVRHLAWLCLGASFLYIGGMFLNDAFDAQFDSQHRPERPIPSGQISATAVWGWGLSWLVLGVCALSFFGRTTASLAVLLAISILIYDALHKIFAFSPLFMAACRFLLILTAASVAEGGVFGGAGLSIWSGLVLAAYVVGLSFLARKESTHGALLYWPCALLAAPVLLALVVNADGFARRAFLLSVALVLWILFALRQAFWVEQPNIGRSVSGLLAGIVLVDLLAVAGGTAALGLVFLGFFVLALVF